MTNEMKERVLDAMQSRGLMADDADVEAIFAAIREPTEGMLKAGRNERLLCQEEMEIWQAMLDAALKG